jgi:flagellar assembly protein FliH
VIRSAQAGGVSAARFDVDLRAGFPVPEHIVAEATAAAHAAGFASGWAQGQRASEAHTVTLHAHLLDEAAAAATAQQQAVRRAAAGLNAAAMALEQQVTATAADLEDLILNTAFDIAEAVLGRELALAENPGRDALARALALTPLNRPVTVRLSPADHTALTSAGGLPPEVEGRQLTMVADPQLRSGDAVADCDATAIDARIETALDRIRQVLP